MRIVYYTSGISGAGRLVIGISIGNALNRKGIKCKYTILHTSPVAHLADEFHNIKLPLETETELSSKNYPGSILFKTLKKLKPDILLVNHQWFMLYNFICDLTCKKIYLSDHAFDSHFKLSLRTENIIFNKDHYDRVLAIEPFESSIPMDRINPLVIRNRDEILTRDAALGKLGLDGTKKVAFYGISGHPEDYERFIEKYSALQKSDYDFVTSSTYRHGLFPAVDYFNAFDLIICGGGYNQVWEANFFNKKAIFETTALQFSDQSLRIKQSEKFHFEANGADQLVDIILSGE